MPFDRDWTDSPVPGYVANIRRKERLKVLNREIARLRRLSQMSESQNVRVQAANDAGELESERAALRKRTVAEAFK